MIWRIGEFLVNVVEVVLLLEFAASLLERKRILPKAAYGATVLAVSSGMSAINYCAELFEGGPPPGITFIIITSLLLLMPLHLLFKDKLGKKAFVLIAFFILVIVTEIIAAILIIVFANTDFSTLTSSGSHRLIGMVMSKSLLIFTVKSYSIRKIGIRDFRQNQIYFALLLLIVSIVMIISLLYFYVNSGDADPYKRFYIVVSSATVLLMNYLIMKQLETVIIQSKEKAAGINAAENYQMQIKFLKSTEENNEKIRIISHDMKNHMIAMKTFVDRQDLAGLSTYLGEMDKSLESKENIRFSSHLSINAILNNKIERAKKSGIYVAISIQIPNTLGVDEFDVCALLGNAIDNAIEACRRMTGDGARTIDINVSEKKGLIVIEISNPASDDDIMNINERISAKSDKENHGFGLTSMEVIAKKYNGEMKLIVQDGRAHFLTILCRNVADQ
jgi:two-component system, LytTR family, sensor histidine kinase AgrC